MIPCIHRLTTDESLKSLQGSNTDLSVLIGERLRDNEQQEVDSNVGLN